MFNKEYDLPIARDYVRHWGMAEAVRELIQNALDSDSPFEWEFTGDILRITSRYAKLEPRTLLLGVTSKAEDNDAIGNFGEGYKIAMLVLTRLQYGVVIHNGDVTWTPKFKLSRKYQVDTLHVVETSSTFREGVTFEVSGLSENDIEEVRASCLQMQKEIGEIKNTQYGRILIDRPGKLFVGGLYICDTGMKYGYDIKPEFITLERDRQTVSSWDLRQVAQKMWIDAGDMELVAELIEQDIPDMEYVHFDAPEIVKEACYKLFQKKHPGAVAVEKQKDLERLVKEGMTNTVFIGSSSGSYFNCVTTHKEYDSSLRDIAKTKTPTAYLVEWLETNRKHMRRRGIEAFKKLIQESQDW